MQPAKVLVNILFVFVPLIWEGYTRQDGVLLGAVLLFLIAGVVVKPERHRYLFGLRREDWFHYMISISSYLIATRMKARSSWWW